MTHSRGWWGFYQRKDLQPIDKQKKKGNKYKDWQCIRKLAYVVCRMLVTKYWTDSSLIRWRIPRESGRTGYTRPTLTAWTSLQVGFTSKDNDYSLSYFKYNFHNVFRPSIHRVRFWGSESLSTSSFPSPAPPLPQSLTKGYYFVLFLFFFKKFSLFFFY